ncbi:MAG: DUF1636 domain-containing protein [Alphaproteobacteria bacterium]|nr:DUF1636 domain-containing protein [Alphaproteobacteria bacterium]
MSHAVACLHVCVACFGAEPPEEGATPPGERLHAAVAALIRDPTLRLAPVTCLANCDRGCSAAISAAGKWTYLLGHLSPVHAEDLVTYALSYTASRTGVVLPSRRPESLRHAIIGRVPAPELPA